MHPKHLQGLKRSSPVYIGADCGGTWLRVCAVDARGQMLRSARLPSPGWRGVPSAVRSLLRRWRLQSPAGLVVGARGVWKPARRKSLTRQLAPLAAKALATSDVELAHRALFGDGAGVLLIAGTGSIAYGRDKKGCWARAGGLGADKGDEGSAYWIGKSLLEMHGRRPNPKKELKETAALAAEVGNMAKQGNLAGIQILSEGWVHLAKLVEQVINQLPEKGAARIGLSGGLFADAYFRKGFLRTARKVLKSRRLIWAKNRQTAELCAARWARSL